MVFRVLKAAYFWAFFPILTAIAVITILSFSFLSRVLKIKNAENVIHSIAGLWARAVFIFMPGWSYEVFGRENLPKAGEAMVAVANHESTADIWAIFTLAFQFRWLSKDAIFKIPGVGQSMRAAGYIAINRGNKKSHAIALGKSAKVIQRGVSMLFFPEGTRSETGELRPFKVGAFKLATEQNVKILPIVLKGSRDLVPKGSTLPGRAVVRIKVLPPQDIRKGETLEHYAARVRELIIENMQGL